MSAVFQTLILGFAGAVFLAGIQLGVAQAQSIAQAQPAVIATGDYPEGLLWHGGRLFFAEMGADRVSVIDGEIKKEFWRDPGCGPTAISPLGASSFLVNCHLAAHLVEVSAAGRTVRRILQAADGTRFLAPNASTADGRGGVFFSDSGLFSREALANGRVFHLSAQGVVTEVTSGLRYANGVAFDAAAHTLYVSEHLARRIHVLKLDSSNRVIESGIFIDFAKNPATASHDYTLAGPDGLALGTEYLAVAEYGEGRVHLFDRDGRYRRTLKVAMAFVDTVTWDDKGGLYAGGAFSNSRAPYEGRVIRFLSAAWRSAP